MKLRMIRAMGGVRFHVSQASFAANAKDDPICRPLKNRDFFVSEVDSDKFPYSEVCFFCYNACTDGAGLVSIMGSSIYSIIQETNGQRPDFAATWQEQWPHPYEWPIVQKRAESEAQP